MHIAFLPVAVGKTTLPTHVARWKMTGLWEQVLQFKKYILTEPRGMGGTFDKTMKRHYDAIRSAPTKCATTLATRALTIRRRFRYT